MADLQTIFLKITASYISSTSSTVYYQLLKSKATKK